MDTPLQIMIVDDDPLVRISLQHIIEQAHDMQVIYAADSAHTALLFLQQTQPDVVLLDIQMPHMNGIECLKFIRMYYPNVRIIILTTFDDDEYVVSGMAYGAHSYLLKRDSFEQLTNHIRLSINNSYIMPHDIAQKIASLLTQKTITPARIINPAFFAHYELSNTEQQIIQLLAKRLTNAEIANESALSIGTVKNYLVTIYEKLNVRSRLEAITLIEEFFL